MLTDQQLADIRARCEAATPGPWEDMCDEKFHVLAIGSGERIATMRVKFDAHQNCANSIFISEARTDIPALLAHIDEQKVALAKAEANEAALVEALEALVEYMGDTSPEDAKLYVWSLARAVLAHVKGEGTNHCKTCTHGGSDINEQPECCTYCILDPSRDTTDTQGFEKKWETHALTWTTEPPKVAGWYWWICEEESMGVPQMVNVTMYADGQYSLHFHDSNGSYVHECDKCQWAGPIPLPQEPPHA